MFADVDPLGRNLLVGWQIERVAETGSTNLDLLEAARGGAPAGLVLVADHQHAGRGRLGRYWVSPPGTTLLMSLLLRPSLPPGQLHLVVHAVGLAAVEACAELSGVRPGLKWPNDLVVGDRKLAGILAESVVAASGSVEAVVVGIGLNLAWPDGAPDDLAGIATTLAEASGRTIGRDDLVAALLDHLARLDPDEIMTSYRAGLTTIGRDVRVELHDRLVEGRAVTVTDDGALVVRSATGADEVLHTGDVVHVRALPMG
jgi:BirA family biotin operon repressor/biotin-[acetyl-CoA-carboxylase] ligase